MTGRGKKEPNNPTRDRNKDQGEVRAHSRVILSTCSPFSIFHSSFSSSLFYHLYHPVCCFNFCHLLPTVSAYHRIITPVKAHAHTH